MNIKRFVAASLAVFVVATVVDFLSLKAAYDSVKHFWRPDMQSMWWMIVPALLVASFLFTYIFVKGYEGKGILEGVRFGAIMGLYTSIATACWTYMITAIPYSLALLWFVGVTVEAIVLGILAALIYKPAASA